MLTKLIVGIISQYICMSTYYTPANNTVLYISYISKKKQNVGDTHTQIHVKETNYLAV